MTTASYDPTNQIGRVRWAITDAEMLEIPLAGDGRLVGKTTGLGVSLGSTAWRDVCRDRMAFLHQRHIMGPA